jgi:hypothetical protein
LGRAPELCGDRLHFVPGTLRTLGITERFGVLDRLAEGSESCAIGSECGRIDQLTAVSAIGVVRRADELEDVNVPVGAV